MFALTQVAGLLQVTLSSMMSPGTAPTAIIVSNPVFGLVSSKFNKFFALT